MFKDVLNFNPDTREALRDPSTAIQRGLPRLLEKIRKKEKQIAKLNDDLNEIQSRSTTQKKGWFSPPPRKPGMLDRWATNSTESLINSHQQEIDQIRELHAFLSKPMYPNASQWTFDQVDEEITTLYRRLAGSYASLEAATAPGRQLQDPSNTIKIKIADEGEQEMANPFAQLGAFLGAIIPPEDLDTTLLTVCKLTVELQGLYTRRRALFKTFLQDMATWEKSRLEVELRKRKRDFDEMPAELQQQKNLAHLSDMSAIVAAMIEQRRFIEDVIFELEAVLEHYKASQKISDPTAEILNQIKELKRKMEAALANETDPDLRAVIKQAYGKKIDALSEKL